MVVFPDETIRKYPERCRIIQAAYEKMVRQCNYVTADVILIIEGAIEQEWDENVRVLAGDGEDTGKWKLLIPFEEYLGQVFKMHVVTGLTLIFYDMFYGEGAFNKMKDPVEYQRIYDNIEPFFSGLDETVGTVKSLNVEVKDGR